MGDSADLKAWFGRCLLVASEEAIADDGSVRWRCVRGALGGMLAICTHFGWRKLLPARWIDLEGQEFSLDLYNDEAYSEIRAKMRDLLIVQQWRRSGQHHSGSGLIGDRVDVNMTLASLSRS